MNKPFDSIFKTSGSLTWGHLLELFMNRKIELKVNIQNIKNLLTLQSIPNIQIGF